jgi:ribosomal protein S1
MKNNLFLVITTTLIIAVAAFFGGIKYQQSKQPSRGDFQAMRGARQGLPGSLQSGTEVVRGEIISQDEESVTVKLPDESSKIVLISENTKINKATEAAPDDLTVGEQVMVFGKKNSDGIISAAQVQLNFEFRGKPDQP